jgi:hypothetical protein
MTAAPVHNPIENAAAGFIFRGCAPGHYSRAGPLAKAKSRRILKASIRLNPWRGPFP